MVALGREQRLRGPVTTLAVVAAATGALLLRDPHRHASWGLCPFKLVTGWDCPACGGLRAVNDLGRGDVLAAWHSNAVFVSAVPLLVLGWLWWLHRAWTGTPRRRLPIAVQHTLIAVAATVVVAFTIWRNTPLGTAFHVA